MAVATTDLVVGTWVRLDPRHSRRNSAWQHFARARIMKVLDNGKLEVLPEGHKHTEVVSIEGVTLHHSRNEKLKELYPGVYESEKDYVPDLPKFVIFDKSKGLFWSAKDNRLTKSVDDALQYDTLAGARRGRSRLLKTRQWMLHTEAIALSAANILLSKRPPAFCAAGPTLATLIEPKPEPTPVVDYPRVRAALENLYIARQMLLDAEQQLDLAIIDEKFTGNLR